MSLMLKAIVLHFQRSCYDVIEDAISGKLNTNEVMHLIHIYYTHKLDPFCDFEHFVQDYSHLTTEDVSFYLMLIRKYIFEHDNGGVRELERTISDWNNDLKNKNLIKLPKK